MIHQQATPTDEQQHVSSIITAIKASLLIQCKTYTLGSSEINERGESLFDFTITVNLSERSRDNTLTFYFSSSENRSETFRMAS